MKTFNFYQKHGNVRITLSANNFDEAEEILMDTVQGDCGWRVEDEDGEDEDEIKSIVSNPKLQHKEKIAELFSLSNGRGNLDNQTTMILEF